MTALLSRIDALQQEILAARPLKAQSLASLREYYKIGLTYTSNALEGNTLTESETKVVIEEGLTIGGKPLKDHYEATGHAEAFDFLYTLLQRDLFTEEDVKKLHHLFFYRIDESQAGVYRQAKVFISGTTYIPPAPEEVPARMETLIKQLPQQKATLHPVEFAAWIHQQFVDIHPFIDGNGRTARLLMNLVLLQAGYAITIIPPIRRVDYIAAIVKSQVAPQDVQPFRDFIAEMVVESLKDYLRILG